VAVALPGAQRAAEQALALVERGSRLVSVVGRDGSGKSSALAMLDFALADRGWRVVRAALPRRGDDAAVVGMLDVGAQLSDELVRGALRDLNRPWSSKLSSFVAALHHVGDRGKTVLLLDDPIERDGSHVSQVFVDRAVVLTQALRTIPNVWVVQTTRWRTGVDDVKLEPGSVPSQVLDPARWTGARREAAEQLSALPRLERYSPLELRLLVALVAGGMEATDLDGPRLEPRRIVERVFARSVSPAARSLIGTLALVRTSFDRTLLDRLGFDTLHETERALLEEALLIREADGVLRLHDLVAREAQERDWLSERSRAHRALASWHDERFAAEATLRQARSALRHEMEAIHQLTEAGDAHTLLRRSIAFVEQLDALGKSLSQKRRFTEAVEVYERALQHDADDAYANHYLAYNLDVEARDKTRSLHHYGRARELEPTHVWYHCRCICLLITIGRLDEAIDAWSEACAQFDDDPLVHTELHRPVAQLLLHRGQLQLARRVLDEVPPRDRSTHDWYGSLDLLLTEQEEAEEQRFVFPPSVERDTRWDGPHLLRDTADHARVLSWMPGRISSQGERGLVVRVAVREEQAVRFGYRELTREELSTLTRYPVDLTLPVGTFVELIKLKSKSGSESEILLSWPRESRRLPGVGEIFPRPDRYIRRAAPGV
jgi:tetratricopeptide (TPR) repeat protein